MHILILKYVSKFFYSFYCVVCEAWSPHRDHDSVGVVFRALQFLFPINIHLKGCTNFIQSLQKGKTSLNADQVRTNVIRKILTELWPFVLRFWLNCGFRSITFEGIQQSYLKFTEG